MFRRSIWDTVICDMLTSTSMSPRVQPPYADRRLEIIGRDAHAEVDTPAAIQRTRNVFARGKVTHKDLCTGPAQSVSAFIVSPNEGLDRNLSSEQVADDNATNAADLSQHP